MEPEKDICPYCRAERRWNVYILAHWSIRLDGTCDSCGKEYAVQNGRAMKLPQRKKPQPH